MLLDEDILAQIRQLGESDTDFSTSLLEAYETQMTQGVEALWACAGEGRTKELCEHAHRLRGSSLNLGAHAMAQLLEVLELQGTTLSHQHINALLQELATTWGATRTAMHAYFAHH